MEILKALAFFLFQMTTFLKVFVYSVTKVCVFSLVGLQGDEGPVRLHPQPYGPLQADSLTNLEALSSHLDLYHHESPAGGGTGKHTTSDITKTTLQHLLGFYFFYFTL